MRIAHCIHGLGLGGAQKVLGTIVSSLQTPDFQHFVYCSLDGPVRRDLETVGATVKVIPRRLPKLDPMWVLALARAMRSDRVDVVHTHLFGDSIHGLLAARRADIRPIVMTLHGHHAQFSQLQRWGYRWVLPQCSAVVACSPSVARSFLDDQASLSRILTTVSNGINFETEIKLPKPEVDQVQADLGLDPNSTLVLAMGRFAKEKGYDFLLRAFSELPDRLKAKTQLLLLGQGPLEGWLKALTRSLDLEDQIVFGGYRQDIRRILTIVDVVAFSSLSEGLSIALLEAMAAGKCIVATDIESFRDVVDNGTEALLAKPADATSLSQKLQAVLKDKPLRIQLGQQARHRFDREFKAEKMANGYKEIYAKALEDTSFSPP